MSNYRQTYMDIYKRRMSRRAETALDCLMAAALGLSFAVLLVWQLSK